ncbi:hypothetical protein GCM10008915_47240 [Bifidobacterium pullorum subsp. gallinarum]
MGEKQTIEISRTHAIKLGEIMEKISDSGVDSITRYEAAEHCIDWVHEMIFKNGSKVRAK